MFWLQLYRFYRNDHAIGFDLIKRATAAGVKVLALTIDVPVRTTRSRESYAGLGREFRPTPRMIYEMLIRPRWLGRISGASRTSSLKWTSTARMPGL